MKTKTMTDRHTVGIFLLLFSIGSLALLSSCRSQSTNQQAALDSLVKQKFGNNAIAEYNEARTYVLYKQKYDSVGDHKVGLKYAVIKLVDNSVALEGTYSRGYVKWLNNSMIEIFSVPEKVKPDQDLAVFKRQVYIEGPNSEPKQ